MPAVPSAAIDDIAAAHGDCVGFLADDVIGFAKCIVAVVQLEAARAEHMAAAARNRALRFSLQAFQQGWLDCVQALQL